MTYSLKTYRCQLVCEGETQFAKAFADSADNAAAIMFEKLANLPVEEVHLLYVNGQNRVTGHEMIARGGQHGCALTAKEILRGPLMAGASAFIMAHNHPSGDPTPSREDIAITRTVKKLSEELGIPLLDHLVVCPESRRYESILEVL